MFREETVVADVDWRYSHVVNMTVTVAMQMLPSVTVWTIDLMSVSVVVESTLS